MRRPYDELLTAYPAFRALPAEVEALVQRDLRSIRATRGQVVFDLGDERRVPFLFQGRIRVLRPLPDGRQVPLHVLTPGDWCAVAVANLLGRCVHQIRAVATDDVIGATLSGNAFLRCLEERSALREAVLDAVAARMLAMMELVVSSTVSTVDQRLATLLLARGPSIRATHQGLADELGTAREVVSRALERFESEGLVRLGRSRIEVTRPQRLEGQQGCQPV